LLFTAPIVWHRHRPSRKTALIYEINTNTALERFEHNKSLSTCETKQHTTHKEAVIVQKQQQRTIRTITAETATTELHHFA
jgi:hypothetical protein